MNGARLAATRSASGHTLWEMLLVLALLGVMSALVAPAAALLRNRSFGSDAERGASALADLLARAHLTALERATTVDVILDPSAPRSWIVVGAFEAREPAVVAPLALPPDVELFAVEPRARFTFTATGTASGPSVLVRGRSSTRVVTVDPWSGAPRVAKR